MSAPDDQLVEQLSATLQKHAGDPAAAALLKDLSKVLATPGSKRTELVVAQKPGLMQRVAQVGRYIISGVMPTTWFGPSQPMRPQADKPDQGTRGRRFDYPVGTNLQYQPKSEPGSGIPFATLRGLANSYDLLALVIETRKDQLCAQDWEIVPIDEKADEDAELEQIKAAKAFLKKPTPDHDFTEWLRAIADDDLICGSVAIYPRPNRGGGLHSMIPIDVAMIKLLIDEFGMTPTFPDPAYQAYTKGVPSVDYYGIEDTGLTTDPELLGLQLAYWRRNPRTNRMYGYSPVEQIIMTVNIALRRQQSQLEYYTEGSIPDMILGVPDTWNPEQLQDFQNQWDDIMSGNTAVRRKVRFTPEMKGIITPKDGELLLTDDTDGWFARIICFAFSISPAALQKMVNRAAGQQMAETAKEEGLLPLLSWYEGKITWILNVLLGLDRVKFTFKTTVEIDPKIQSEIDTAYVDKGIISRDEARRNIKLEPRGDGADDLTVTTATGPVPVKEAIDRSREDLVNPPQPIVVAPGGPAGPSKNIPKNTAGAGKKPQPGAKNTAKPAPKGVAKPPLGKARRGRRLAPTGVVRATAKDERRLTTLLTSVLRSAGKRFGARAAGMLAKDDASDAALVERMLKELDTDGVSVQILDELSPTLKRLFQNAGISAIASVGINTEEAGKMTDHVDALAEDYVAERGAELVTQISETTRDDLRGLLSEGVKDGWSPKQLADEIEGAHGFSGARAMMIARTELSYAHVRGNVAGWEQSGVVGQKQWVVGEGCCDDCQELDGVVVDLDEDFDYADGPVAEPPAHPNCRCDVLPVLAEEDSADEE